MAATITVEEVRENFPPAGGLADFEIQGLIDLMNMADICLDGLALTGDQEKLIKLNGVKHIITLLQHGGVQSETTKTGASRSYFDGDSINSTSYGKALQSMAGSECILAKAGSDSRVWVGPIKGLS